MNLSYKEFETILSCELLNSAFKRNEWWGNEKNGRHVQAKAWLNAGWKVQNVSLGEYVIFKRM
ncbi:DUF7662 domain-containing protein [Lysinibacillus xylanilyticus]|uniref:DUF7662 domain-containing protein n=1 Tax=Lysinibacillus xylanilyticus TaxID=582475 RepID=UPI003D00F90F